MGQPASIVTGCTGPLVGKSHPNVKRHRRDSRHIGHESCRATTKHTLRTLFGGTPPDLAKVVTPNVTVSNRVIP